MFVIALTYTVLAGMGVTHPSRVIYTALWGCVSLSAFNNFLDAVLQKLSKGDDDGN